MNDEAILEARGVSVTFAGTRRRGSVAAVRNVDLSLTRGETVGVVGESGSGKSTLARALLGVRHLSAGEIRFDGRPLTGLSRGEMLEFRRRVQIVSQDPFSSLNPRLRVGSSVAEPLRTHTELDRDRRRAAVGRLLERVGLHPNMASRYPHEFSGGQRQRIAIARALALQPDVLICDEPTSALDVSVQAQVLNLLRHLQADDGVAMVFIAHDLAVVRRMVSRVVVMAGGEVVETGSRDQIYGRPSHSYTQTLLDAVPGGAR